MASTLPEPGANRTALSGNASAYASAWSHLEQRRVDASPVPLDRSFENEQNCRMIVRNFFSLLLGEGRVQRAEMPNRQQQGEQGQGLKGGQDYSYPYGNFLKVFDAKYEDEEGFNLRLFEVLGASVQGVLGEQCPGKRRWTAEIVEKKMILLKPYPPIAGAPADFAMGVVRKTVLPHDATSVLRTPAKPDHAWVIVERGGSEKQSGPRRQPPVPPVWADPPKLPAALRKRIAWEAVPLSTASGAGGIRPLVDAEEIAGKQSARGVTRDEEDEDATMTVNVKVASAAVPKDDESDDDGGGSGDGDGADDNASGGDESDDDDDDAKGSMHHPEEDEDDWDLAKGGTDGARNNDDGAASGEWKVRNALAVVGLKTEKTACAPFKTFSRDDERCVDPSSVHIGKGHHGPLAQAILYNLAHVLRGRAALGPESLPPAIPTAVVACRSPKPKGKSRRNWVVASLLVPDECGARFLYGVKAFGPLKEAVGENHSSLAAYFHVMASGLEAGSEWFEVVRLSRELPSPSRMSGRTLNFGVDNPLPHTAGLRPVGTPVWRHGGDDFAASQGEIFEVTVCLSELRSQLSVSRRVFWFTDSLAGVEKALVKVSSLSCFNMLLPNLVCYLFLLGRDSELWESGGTEKIRKVKELLSPSIRGVYQSANRNGLVQLLPNLHSQGFRRLFPHELLHRDGWSALWNAVATFVKETLFPLAEYGFIHTDIRVGYDVMSNLLWKPTGGIRMIDLDSVCAYDDWATLPQLKDKRYISHSSIPPWMENATGYVLLQVVCIGESWLAKRVEKKVDTSTFIEKWCGGGSATAELDIDSLLDNYKARLGETFGTEIAAYKKRRLK